MRKMVDLSPNVSAKPRNLSAIKFVILHYTGMQSKIESIKRFPDQSQLSSVIRSAEFKLVKHRNLSGGIAAIHSGWKI